MLKLLQNTLIAAIYLLLVVAFCLSTTPLNHQEQPPAPPPVTTEAIQPPQPTFYYQEVTLTAYTASIEECGKSDGITASGVEATQGRTIAADHLPFGTLVEINGHVYTVEDRFGGGYSDKIDVYFEDYQEALEFGRQRKTAKIYL